ncbi:MAG: PGF-CTERM sorting domain-containing protein [Halobacteriota archaeon]
MRRASARTYVSILVVTALIAVVLSVPIAGTTMVTTDKNTTSAGNAVIIQANLGKPGNTATIEYYYDANKNGVDDDGSSWTSISEVKDGGSNSLIKGTSSGISYRWVPPSDLPPGHYLVRVSDSDNSTPKIAPIDLTRPAAPQISFLVDGSSADRVKPGGFVTVQADVSNNCALCHNGDPSTWTAADPGFDEQKMKEHIKADLSGISGKANDTAVPAQMMLGHGKVGWNVAVSPYLQEGAQSKIFFAVTEANLTISSHNATNEENNATSSATSNATKNETNILNETETAESNSTLTITAISAPTYVNDSVAVNVTVKNRGADIANSTYLVFENLPNSISVDNGGVFDIGSNSTATFAVKITAASGASGNYDLRFHATSGNVTSENRTIPVQIGNPSASTAKSQSPLPGFEVVFALVGLVVAAYVLSRRR